MMKQIIQKFFSIVIITILLLVTSCGESKLNNNENNPDAKNITDDCIKMIITADDSLGSVRNNACREISLSQTIINYTAGLESLDFSNCPKPFSDAFQSHIKAWNNMLKETDNYPDLRGEMHDLFDQIKAGSDSTKFKILEAEIWSTWSAVEEAMKK